MVTLLLALSGCRAAPQPPPATACPELVWVEQVGSKFREFFTGVDIATNGDILVGGGFSGTVTFGHDLAGEPVTRSACGNNDHNDAFVARYLPDGRVRSVSILSSCDITRVQAIAATPSGGAVASGMFDDRLEVDGTVFRNEAVAEFHLQLWVASWSADGDLEWLVLDQARSLGLSGRVIKEREKMA